MPKNLSFSRNRSHQLCVSLLQDDKVSYTEVMNRMKNQGADSFYRPLRPDGSVYHFEVS